jgi:hypothetical protein
MQTITTGTGLIQAIHLLEAEKAAQEALLKELFNKTYIIFRPANLLKGTLRSAVKSPYLIENIVVAGMGIATGYFTNKIVAGASSFLFRKLFGRLIVHQILHKTPNLKKP